MKLRHRKLVKSLILFVILVTTPAPPVVAQVTPEPIRGDYRNFGARGGALGEALGADSYDMEAVLSNPGSLTTLQRGGIVTSHRQGWDLKVSDDALSARFGRWGSHSVGGSVRITHAGYLASGGDLKFQQVALDLAYAYELITDLSIGIIGGGRLGSHPGGSAFGYSMSVGILYSPSPAVSYGLAMRDLGANLRYPGSNASAGSPPEPDVFRVAALEISSTLRFPSKSRSPIVQLLVSVEHRLITREYSYRGGLEVIPWDFLPLRLGYVNTGSWTMASAGAGVRFGGIEADFAIMPHESGNRFHEFGLKYFF